MIGINFFKKFIPTTVDLARKNRNIKQIKLNNKDRLTELYRYELKTRTLEIRHIIGLAIFILLAFFLKKDYCLFDYVFVLLLLMVLNVYPILLQRHNRIRILNVLKTYGRESPFEKST